jgi:hypothetical protein
MEMAIIKIHEENNPPVYAIPVTDEPTRRMLNYYKGQVINVLELVCPTEKSLNRAKKNMHDIFEELYAKITPE